MIKTYKMFLALMLCALGAISVSAGERVVLTNDMFVAYDGWDALAEPKARLVVENPTALGTASGCPIGDTSCNAWADLSKYSKLYIEMEGCDDQGAPNNSNPRIFINRLEAEGQFNATKANAKCLVIPNDGTWAADYYTKDGNKYVIDLTKIKQDFGFVHFHSIKGSSWNTKAIVHSIEAELADESTLTGWVSYIKNGSLEESNDVTSFPLALNASVDQGVHEATIVEGVGKSGSRAIVLSSMSNAPETWSTQLFVKFDKFLPEGTEWRFSMAAKIDTTETIKTAHITTSQQAEPRAWKAGDIIPAFDLNGEWQKIEATGTVTPKQASDGFGSIAFDLNNNKTDSIKYYFDNIRFDIYKVETKAIFASYVVTFDFGYPTNIADLVKASGKTRLVYPADCATAKVNGQPMDILAVEGTEDGRLIVFLADYPDETAEVNVAFANPTDAAYNIVFTDGPNVGKSIADFDLVAKYDKVLAEETLFPYAYELPQLVSSDPEEGSFNLPVNIKEFKVKFNKLTDGSKLLAKLDNEALTVAPAELATEFTLTRNGADLNKGAHKLSLTKVYPEEIAQDDYFAEFDINIYVGMPEADPSDTVRTVIPVSYFEGCADGSIPEGFKIRHDDGSDRIAPNNYSGAGGGRVMTFGTGGDFTKGLYMRVYEAEYGLVDEDHELNFKTGEKYDISFNAASWTTVERYLNFQIWKATAVNDSTASPLFSQIVKCTPTLSEKKDAVNGSTKTQITWNAPEDGKYVMRWVVATGADGIATEGTWQNGIILANVEVTYKPNTIGVEEVTILNKAIANAKTVRDGNAGERYEGEAFTALDAAIQKYDAEKANYTNPSAYTNAAADLDALSETLKAHRQLCDNYDAIIKKAIDVVRQNEMPNGDPEQATKFTKTEKFAELKALVEKYHGASEWVKTDSLVTYNVDDPTVIDTITYTWNLNYVFDVLTDDAALTPAITELTALANLTSLLFTEGQSDVHGYNNSKGTGVAVLVDRLRLGGETLKALGTPEDDELITSINNALTDDDELAAQVKYAITTALYNKLKEDKDFLAPTVEIDEETLAETKISKTIDMTAFVKNPNIYVTTGSNYSAETVPGWVVPTGYNAPGLSFGWDDVRGGVDVPADATFQTWGGAYRVEQTITDLPAGIYTIKMGYGERDTYVAETFAYAITSQNITTQEVIDEETFETVMKTTITGFTAVDSALVQGQDFPSVYKNDKGTRTIDSLVVTDGTLILGVNAPAGSHTFFNNVRLTMIGAIDGFDYAKALDDVISGIDENAVKPTQVRALQLFDLNGRRITTARPGIVIVKKLMSDGSVRIEKVVKK